MEIVTFQNSSTGRGAGSGRSNPGGGSILADQKRGGRHQRTASPWFSVHLYPGPVLTAFRSVAIRSYSQSRRSAGHAPLTTPGKDQERFVLELLTLLLRRRHVSGPDIRAATDQLTLFARSDALRRI